MVEDTNGAVCTLDNSADGTVMTTHRLSKSEWDAAVAAFSTNQASINTAITGTAGNLSTITVGNDTIDPDGDGTFAKALDYMDALNCANDPNNHFLC